MIKLNVNRQKLIDGLQAATNVISTRVTLPILHNALFSVEDGTLTLTGTDLDLTTICSVGADIKEHGKTTIPARRMLSVIRELSGESVEIEVNDKDILSLHSAGSSYTIYGLQKDEYPNVFTVDGDKMFRMSQEKLAEMLGRVAFAMSEDETRYVLNGALFELGRLTPGALQLSIVATDGRRLGLTSVDVEAKFEGNFILPSKSINELRRHLETGGVEIRFCEDKAMFVIDTEEKPRIVLTKLIEGQYPNYRQVIPSEPKHRIELKRESFLQALRRAELMTSEKARSVKLTFGNKQLDITANTPGVGDAKEIIETQYNGKGLSSAYNPKYLIDPLAALTVETVFLDFIDELSPAVLRIAEAGFLNVIMPMRLS